MSNTTAYIIATWFLLAFDKPGYAAITGFFGLLFASLDIWGRKQC